MTKVLGMELAPLFIPFQRRLQTLAVFHYVSMFIILPVFTVWAMVYIAFYTHYWWTLLIYVLWFIYDIDTPKRGGRPASWFRNATLWKWLRDYFPVSLEKTSDLDPSKNYIIGAHPHGLFSIGSYCNFGTEATGFSKLFPGITCHMCTLVGQFWFPLRREYVMFADAHPGRIELVLNRRKGFVKLAIQRGADLVPSFSFGENELFNQVDNPPGSMVRKMQDFLKSVLGFSLPVFHGRGIFNYSFGILPFRQPLTTIVGKPICVEKTAEPSREMVDKLHKEYVDGLCAIFEDNKLRFGYTQSDHIRIV